MGWDDTSESCCNPEQVGDIIACVCELKKTIECVAECFSGHVSSGTKQKILFCLVLQEIKNIEDLLNNKVFGLNEIKNEIRVIENTVLSPTIGLNEIKNEIKGIENTLGNFPEVNITINIINEVVAGINETLNNEIFGLNEIKNEIRVIENTVLSPTIGLNEIKNEIKGIENAIGNLPEVNITVNIINEIVAGINETLNNEIFGLNEIKNEIRVIENTVLSPTIGLNEIKNEIKGIENAIGNLPEVNITISIINEIVAGINETLNNEIFGLNEIKNEIRAIENNTGAAAVLTTGPVVAPPGNKNLRVKVLNNSQANQTVQIQVFNLEECPKCLNLIFNAPLGPIPASCACEVSGIDLNAPTEYEVQVSGIVPGIYLWSGAAPGGSSNFITETVFRHVDFVRQVFNNC